MATDDAQGLKGNKAPTETIFDKSPNRIYRGIRIFRICLRKNFVRICLYIFPLLLFFACFDFTKTSLLFTEKTGINYIASYCLYIVVIELARKLHTDTKKSTHARHVFNQSFVYFPLALFLFTASYALYSAGTEVFGAISEEKSPIQVDEKVKEYLTTYQLKCEKDAATSIEQHKCIEKFLSGNLFAEIELLQKQYEGTSNSYSIIAIMTGFFGVLMTVLVIYFSLSGREVLEQKLTASDKLIKDMKEALKKANDTSEEMKKALNDANDTSEEVKKALNDANDTSEEVKKALNDATEVSKNAKKVSEDAIKTAAQASEDSKNAIDEAKKAIDDAIKTAAKASEDSKNAIDEAKKTIDDAIKTAAQASEDSKNAIDAANKAIQAAKIASAYAVNITDMSHQINNIQKQLAQGTKGTKGTKGEGKDKTETDQDKSQNEIGGTMDGASKKSNSGVKQGDSNTIKTFDDRLNITGGESLKEREEYTLTFYTCQEDFENKHNPIELKQALPYPFEVDKINADSAEVIARFDEKTILVIASHSSTSESLASEEVFYFKPSNAPKPDENAPKPDDSDKHKKIETTNDTNKIQATN